MILKSHFIIPLVLSILGCSLVDSHQDCRTEDFTVKPDFNETMFAGKWYEAKWILEPWVLLEWNFFDFNFQYTNTSYGFSIQWEGRWPFNETTCFSDNKTKLYRTEVNAKYIREYRKTSKDPFFNSTYWIIDTDYDNYALVYGCREEASNGTCVDHVGFMWTRCPEPDPMYIKTMEDKLHEVCLTPEDFVTTYHNQDCSETPKNCMAKDDEESKQLTTPCANNGKGVHTDPAWMTFVVAIIGLVWMQII